MSSSSPPQKQPTIAQHQQSSSKVGVDGNSGEDVDVDFSNLWIKFPRIWEDLMDLSWSRQIYDGRRVLKYQMSAVGPNYRVERYFGADEHSFRLLGLVPNMTIDVQVRVLVESPSQGPVWCAWASSSATTMNAADVSVGQVSSESIHGRITWGSDLVRSGPTATHVAAAAEKFQIKVRQKGRILSNDVCERELPSTAEEFLIEDFDSNAVFEVQIRAISVYGDVGRWCHPVRFLTLSPVTVKVAELGENYAICQWEREKVDNFDTAEGSIEELVVVVELLPSQRELDVDPQARKVQVDAKTFSNETRLYRVNNLLPGRRYSIRSRYHNVLGDWTEWTTTSFKMLNAVSSPDVQLVGHNFVQVHWQREEDDEATGFVEGAAKDVQQWEVRCATGNVNTSMELPSKEVETKLVNLQPGVDYSIDVRAQTRAGEWGPWSVPVTVTTLHRLAPRVEVAGETWLKASWDRKEKRYRDNITRYHIQLNCVNSPFRLTKYFPASVTNHTFDNLKPGTKYVLVMQAFSDQRWGPWSEPVEVSTCAPCVPTLNRRGEDFVHVRWRSDYYDRNQVENLDQVYQIRLHRPPANEDGTDTSSASPTQLQEDQVSQAAYRIQRIPPFSRVLIQVRSFDYMLQSWCDWGPEVEFRTLPSAVVKTHVGETFVDVSWSRAPRILSAVSDNDFDNGVEDPLYPENALQYVLRLNSVDEHNTHREVTKYYFDNAHATTFTVSELTPDHLYSLQLSYLDTEKRWSPQSAPIRFRTMPQLQVMVLDVGEGFASLQWGRWSGGKEVPMESQGAYKIVLQDVADTNATPIQFHVQDVTKYTVPNLIPNTLFRVQVAASPKGTTAAEWGVWSEAVYVCTTAPMEAQLELVGEDYAQLCWRRLARDNLLNHLPDPRLMVVSYDDKAPKPPAGHSDPAAARDGHPVYVGDDVVSEYHVQLFVINVDEATGEKSKSLFFDTKLGHNHTAVRIPGLRANTEYEGFVAASVSSKEWGCWSNALTFKTSMPTEVRVGAITQDAVTIIWGKGPEGEAVSAISEGGGQHNAVVDENVQKYQLRIQGVDDEYLLEVDKPNTEHSYEVKGLNINSCYAVAVRSFLKSEMEWTPFCHKIYIVLKVVTVEVLETSQDWAHLQWYNKVAPDNRPKVQFLTLLGEGTATTVTLGAAEKSHIFHDLSASALYTAHLLSVEETGAYVKVPPSAGQQNYARTVQSGSNTTNFSIPLVAADFSMYLADGMVFRTHRSLDLSLDRVGQNFVLLSWSSQDPNATTAPADGDGNNSAAATQNFANELFEVEVVDIDTGDSKPEPRLLRTQGSHMFVRQLSPASTVRCSVRWVAKHSDAPCKWSAPVVARLLPMIEPALGAGDGTDVPGVGEDYLLVHWDTSLRNSNFESFNSLSFEVRLMPLEGPDSHKEVVSESKTPNYHFSNLRPDTKFQIQVRTVISHSGVVSEVIRGEWSKPLICTTLSPMAVAVTDIVEIGAVVHWRRKNCAVGKAWWENVPEETIQQEIATISSFHIRATTISSPEGGGEEPLTVFDEQFGIRHQEYNTCTAKLKGLKPGGNYAISVRASTGMLWGAWSSPVEFKTQLPVLVKATAVGDSWVVAEWVRHAAAAAAAAASSGSASPPEKKSSRNSQVEEDGEERDSDADLDKASTTPPVDEANAPADAAPVAGEQAASQEQEQTSDDAHTGSILHWELSFCTVGTDKKKHRVTVDRNDTRHCVGGLTPNKPYTVCVRPCYKEEEFGPWSIPLYFVTLAPLKVDVGKVGETFVQVSWEREPQRTISSVMRYKHLEAVKALDLELREYEDQLEDLRSSNNTADRLPEGEESDHHNEEKPAGGEEPLSMADLDGADSPTGGNNNNSSTTASATNNKGKGLKASRETTEKYLLSQVDATRAKIDRERKLVSLQIADLERNAVYPKGEEQKFELVVHGGNTASDAAADDVAAQPFLFKRKLGRGEMLCRLESLNPKCLYQVTVRSLYCAEDLLSTTKISGGAGPLPVSMSSCDEVDDETKVPWGCWSEKSQFITLKPISISTKCIGSQCIAVEWDTGLSQDSSSSRTAITKFQIHLQQAEKNNNNSSSTTNNNAAAGSVLGGNPAASTLVGASSSAHPDITLDDPSLKGHVVAGLTPNTQYNVRVRVCYEGDKWGVWSAPIHFITMPKLLSKLESVAERQIELLIWRDAQNPVPEGQGIVVWNPLVTEHQLAINDAPCAHTFNLEQGTSTLLTLDTLGIDQEYTITVRDKVVDHWQPFQPILTSETIPHSPLRPTLQERKGIHVSVAWKHKQALPNRQYIYALEMALVVESQHQSTTSRQLVTRREPGPFTLLGFTVAQEYRFDLPYAIHDCYFRVKVCKTNQTIDGDPHPIVVPNPNQPQAIIVDNPHVYVWSTCSQVAHFRTPSLPDHPTHLHVVNLTNNSATLKWNKPTNHSEHTDIIYRVFLNNSYLDQFTCVAETQNCFAPLLDLLANCHYRVSVTAESTMGRSVHNNTLHFSTHFEGGKGGKSDGKGTGGQLHPIVRKGTKREKPLTSTLPPRSQMNIPKKLRDRITPPQPAADDVSVLLDERASTALSGGVKMYARPGFNSALSIRGSPDRRSPESPVRHGALPPLTGGGSGGPANNSASVGAPGNKADIPPERAASAPLL